MKCRLSMPRPFPLSFFRDIFDASREIVYTWAMAEPVRKPMEPDLLDEEPGITLQRWVEGPGGRMELVEMPLTPELFLNPQVGDKMTQGKRHGETVHQIADL